MPNCKVGDLAIVVKSYVPNSKNYGKILKIERQATVEELQSISPVFCPDDSDIIWKVDTKIHWYLENTGELFLSVEYCLDSVLKPLKGFDQDFDESEENVSDKLSAYKAVYSKKETV